MTRAREDRALEVWVGGGRELAGWLIGRGFLNIPLNVKDVMIFHAHIDDAGEVIDESRGFSLTPVHQVIDAVDLQRWGAEWLATQVPLYALPTKLISDQTQYSWRVLRLDQSDYGWLFDHPDFVPVDTPRDRDQIANGSVVSREDFEDALAYALLSPSASTYSVQSTSDATSSRSDETSSAMTVETLQKAMEHMRRTLGLSKSALT